MLGPSQLRRMRGSKLLGFLNLPVTSKRTLVHLRKHWEIVKSRRKRQLVEETVEMMSTGRGPYNSHKASCSKVEVVASHFNSDIAAALRSTGYTVAVTTIVEYLDTPDFSTTTVSVSRCHFLHQRLKSWSAFSHHLHPSWGPQNFKFDYYM